MPILGHENAQVFTIPIVGHENAQVFTMPIVGHENAQVFTMPILGHENAQVFSNTLKTCPVVQNCHDSKASPQLVSETTEASFRWSL